MSELRLSFGNLHRVWRFGAAMCVLSQKHDCTRTRDRPTLFVDGQCPGNGLPDANEF